MIVIMKLKFFQMDNNIGGNFQIKSLMGLDYIDGPKKECFLESFQRDKYRDLAMKNGPMGKSILDIG